MRKVITIVTVVLANHLGWSQNALEIGEFTEVKIANKTHIEIVESTENKVEIIEGEAANITLENSKGRLIIKNNIKSFIKEGEYPLRIKLYAKNLQLIDVESGSYVYSKGTITKNFTIEANLASEVHLTFKAKEVKANANSGAKIILKGSIDHLNANAATSGSIIAKDDITLSQSVMARVNTGGIIEIKTDADVDAQTKAGGRIDILGTPKTLKQKINFGGSINVL